MAHLEKNGQFFQVCRSQSVLIFSILNHLVPVWFIITFLVFFYLSTLLFWGFLRFKGDFALRENDFKISWHSSFNLFLNCEVSTNLVWIYFQSIIYMISFQGNLPLSIADNTRRKEWDRVCNEPISRPLVQMSSRTHLHCWWMWSSHATKHVPWMQACDWWIRSSTDRGKHASAWDGRCKN